MGRPFGYRLRAIFLLGFDPVVCNPLLCSESFGGRIRPMRNMTEKDVQDIRENFPLDDCLPAPDLSVSPAAARLFDATLDAALAQAPGAEIDYHLPYPKYLFLDYLAEKRGLMLHGSLHQGLTTLEPIRETRDANEFGDQPAIYATPDPLWALFFAVLDRALVQGFIHNGAIQLQADDGSLIRRYYYCLDVVSLRQNPWKPGAIYLLPGERFEPDPTQEGMKVGKYTLLTTHWLCRTPVQPLARLPVEPEDFPFLHRVWGYDAAAMDKRMEAESIAGFPFLNDPVVYPIRP